MKHIHNNLAVAALSFEVNATGLIQLLPAGKFRAIDGRPENCDAWRIDGESAAALIATISARKNDKVIDYQHQTLLTAQNGQPAPAAGWMKSFEWRDGEGLFATVEWTDRAKGMIEAGEYKYFSPTIVYDPATGVVRNILHGALTNFPAIDGMDELSVAAASAFSTFLSSAQPQPETAMDKLLEQLLEQLSWMLGMPTGSTIQDYINQLTKIIDQLKAAGGSTAAASFDLAAHLSGMQTQIATLSSAAPDPSKFVPLETYAALQAKFAALNAKGEETERVALLSAGQADGRILGDEQVAYWGKQPLAALKAWMDVAKPIDALSSMQTGGKDPAGVAGLSAGHSADEVAVMKALGLSPEEFAIGKQEK